MNFLTDMITMLWETLTDWPLGTIVGIILLVCVLVLIGLVMWGLFMAIDSWFLPRRHGTGRIVGKTFTPAHTGMIVIYNAATKTSMPHPIFHPDDWSVSVEVDGRQDSVSVSREFFNSLSENSSVMAEYVWGRFSRNLYIKGLSRV